MPCLALALSSILHPRLITLSDSLLPERLWVESDLGRKNNRQTGTLISMTIRDNLIGKSPILRQDTRKPSIKRPFSQISTPRLFKPPSMSPLVLNDRLYQLIKTVTLHADKSGMIYSHVLEVRTWFWSCATWSPTFKCKVQEICPSFSTLRSNFHGKLILSSSLN